MKKTPIEQTGTRAMRRRGACRSRVHQGFTLVELIVTTALLAIVLALGVPGFQGLLRDNRALTLSNSVVEGLQIARSEATKWRKSVEICRKNSVGDACEHGADWSVGWLIHQNGTVLKVWQMSDGISGITGPRSGLTYHRDGSVDGAATFTIELPGCAGDGRRIVSVTPVGWVDTLREDC